MTNRTLLFSLTVALATSALSSVALPSMASAADLAPYAKAPMLSPATNWSGFYGGVNVGYGWGNDNMSLVGSAGSGFPGIPQSIGSRSSGALGGDQIGYNWQMGTFVTGLEADIQASGIRGMSQAAAIGFDTAPNELDSATSERKLSWFGTVRGRVGVTLTPSLLLFGTGGLAYGSVRNSGNGIQNDTADIGALTIVTNPASVAQTKVGWTAGAGVEWMFFHNWSAKAEYLHVDLGTSSAVGSTELNGAPFHNGTTLTYRWQNSFDIVRAGVNYHFN
jgi:outer membrane immunogenic protein